MGTLAAFSIMIMWELTIDPATLNEFIGMLKDNIVESRTYEGNLQFDVFVDPSREGKVIFIERWASEEIRQGYMKWRAEDGGVDQIQAYFLEPPILKSFNQVIE